MTHNYGTTLQQATGWSALGLALMLSEITCEGRLGSGGEAAWIPSTRYSPADYRWASQTPRWRTEELGKVFRDLRAPGADHKQGLVGKSHTSYPPVPPQTHHYNDILIISKQLEPAGGQSDAAGWFIRKRSTNGTGSAAK